MFQFFDIDFEFIDNVALEMCPPSGIDGKFKTSDLRGLV